MEKTIAVGAIGVLAMIVLVNAIAESAAYLTDMIGEILIICGLPIVLAVIGYGIYRAVINTQVGRIDALERNLYMERIAIENEEMRHNLLVVRPIDNVLPVARHLIESGEVVNQSFQLLSENIDSRRTYPNMPNSISYTNKNDNHVSDAQALEDTAPALVPEFNDLYKSGKIGKGEVMLGYTEDGPIYASPHKLKSMVCGGLSGSGKSNTTRFLLAQYAMLGWQLAIFDPHGNSEEGILPSLMPLASSFFMEPAQEFDEGVEMLRCVMMEGERRASITGSKQSDFRPLLFVIDEVAEFAAMASDEERAYVEKSLPIILKSFRKFNIFGFCISQFWSQSDMGKLGFLLRRASQTSLIHRMPEDSARIIERYSDFEAIEYLSTGTCLLNNTDIKRTRLQIPLCEAHHIIEVLPTAEPTAEPTADHTADHTAKSADVLQLEDLQPPTMAVGAAVPTAVGAAVPEEHIMYMDAAEDLTPSQRMRVEDALNNGLGNGQIIATVFDHPSKTNDRKGRKYAQMINGVRLEMGMPLPYSPARTSK